MLQSVVYWYLLCTRQFARYPQTAQKPKAAPFQEAEYPSENNSNTTRQNVLIFKGTLDRCCWSSEEKVMCLLGDQGRLPRENAFNESQLWVAFGRQGRGREDIHKDLPEPRHIGKGPRCIGGEWWLLLGQKKWGDKARGEVEARMWRIGTLLFLGNNV